ncbi:MAG: M14 family metallocarboxypeptidase, partial [Phycisphaerae bacterium]
MPVVGSTLTLITSLSLVVSSVSASRATERVRYDNHRLVNVTLTSQADADTMLEISKDFWTERVGVGTVPFRVPPEQMRALADSGLAFSIVHEDVQRLIDEQRGARPAEPAGWFDDFKTYDEVNAHIDTLVALRPDLVTKLDLGQTLEGRSIYGMRVTAVADVANAPAVLFNGTQHAREWISPMVCMYIADALVQTYDGDAEVQGLMDEVVFYIVPIVNADGYVYAWDVERLWRKNRRDNGGSCFGVDNNRNWGFNWGDDASSSSDPCGQTFRGGGPFSEPETQVLRDFILAHPRILAHMDVHSYGQDLFSPYGEISGQPPEPDRTTFQTLNAELSAAIFAVHGMVYDARPSTSYLSGGCAVWTYNDRDILSWTLELRDEGTYGFLLPADQIIPTCEENFEGVKVLAGYIALPFTFSFPQGLPGRVTPNTEATVSVDITEVSGTVDPATAQVFMRIGASGPFASGNMSPLGGGSFEAVLPAVPCGSVIQYYFRAVSTTGSVRTSPEGAPAAVYGVEAIDTVIAMSDDIESDSGWTVGAADDDATTGVWVRVDPNGTAAQPEDDHTPSGTHCWVTGQGAVGGGLGDNDVDEGKTTLYSPVLDLTDLDAIVSYWRWYSNDTGAAPNTDVFVVDISSDGGGEWFEVETVGPAGLGTSGGWIHHEFRVGDVVDPTSEVILRFIASDL